jgi:hypothetical protein
MHKRADDGGLLRSAAVAVDVYECADDGGLLGCSADTVDLHERTDNIRL